MSLGMRASKVLNFVKLRTHSPKLGSVSDAASTRSRTENERYLSESALVLSGGFGRLGFCGMAHNPNLPMLNTPQPPNDEHSIYRSIYTSGGWGCLLSGGRDEEVREEQDQTELSLRKEG